MSYVAPIRTAINFEMVDGYSAPTKGAINFEMGVITTTTINLFDNPLEANTEVKSDLLWYVPLITIEGASALSNPEIILAIDTPPLAVTVDLNATAQQRVICQPIESPASIIVAGVQEVPEGYTVLSPWPFLNNSALSMDSIGIAVVDAAFNNECNLSIPFIEANGETVIDIGAFSISSMVRSDIMPMVIVEPFESGGAELYCMAVKTMPAGDTYLSCPPFQTAATLADITPIFGFSMPPMEVVTQITVEDVYQGGLSVLDPLVISSELSAMVSATVVVNPLQLGSELSPDFITNLGIAIQPLGSGGELFVEDIVIGTFVELVPLECRADMDLDTQVDVWLFNGESSEETFWGHFRMETEVNNPDIIRAVVCEPFGITSGFDIGDIKHFNLDYATRFYYFTLAGGTGDLPEVEIPISSFQSRRRNGAPSYLQVTIPGLDYVEEINDRADGDLRVWLVHKLDGEEVSRKELVTAEMEDIRIDEGSNSKTITLTGHKTDTYTPSTIELTGATYKNVTNGKFRFRVATPNTDLQPGDTVTIDDTTFTADIMSYYFTATKNGINQNMEVSQE